MCGIIGRSGDGNSIQMILGGIKDLEYRGYDSFGIAFIESDSLVIKKDAGRIDDIIEEFDLRSCKSNISIAHTRWATHGKATAENAHPFVDCTRNFAVVHNGIIENYNELKKNLNKHQFLSETDSEVLVHMLEENIKGGLSLMDSIKKIMNEIKGSSAFAFISLKERQIVAAKKGSPLVFGVGENANYISSDVQSLINYTNKYIFLVDGDIVKFSSHTYKIENVIKRIKHKTERIDSHGIRYDLGKFNHFMEKEIFDQFKMWESYKNTDNILLEKVSNVLKNARRIYIIGSGSSYYASEYGAFLFRDAGFDALAIEPQQVRNYKKIIDTNDCIFIVSQSGETFDIINNLEYFKKNIKIALINTLYSSLTRSVDIVIPMNAGTEKSVAATKSVGASLLFFIILYSKLSNRETSTDLEFLLNNRFNIYVPSVENLVNKVSEALNKFKSVFIVARNEDCPIALEGALKLKEVSYVNATAIDMATMKHGPLALITNDSLVIAIVSPGTEKDAVNNLEEIRSRGAYIVGISTSNMTKFDLYIRTVNAGIFYPIPILFIFQMLAYKTSIKNKIDPDKPRNLAKSVTVK